MLRVDDGAGGRDDGDGAANAVVVENVVFDEAAEAVERGRHGDGEVGVDAAGSLRVGAGEVDGGVVAGDGDGAADVDGSGGEAVVVEGVGEFVATVRDGGDGAAEHA